MLDSNKLTVHYYHYGVDELAYFDTGKDNQPTLLLIHGFGEDHCIWKQAEKLLRRPTYYKIILKVDDLKKTKMSIYFLFCQLASKSQSS